MSHPNCKTAHPDDTQPPAFFFRISSPGISSEQGKMKKKTGKERREDERQRCRKEWWNLRCFSCNSVPHLCVQKAICSEWSSGRWDLEGTQFQQVGPRGEAMGLLMYSARTFMESNLKKRAFIQTQRQMESHAGTSAQRKCGNVCCLVAHMCTSSPRRECSHTQTLIERLWKYSAANMQSDT